MKKLLIFSILIIMLFFITSCSKHFVTYDNMQFYEFTETINTVSERSDNTKYRLTHAYGAYYFLEAQISLPTLEGDTVPCWVPIQKFQKLKDK